VARQLPARVLAYAHSYLTSSRPSLGIPGTPASCWGRRESHFGSMLVFAPLFKYGCNCAACCFFESIIYDTLPQAVSLLPKKQFFVSQKITNKLIPLHLSANSFE
jgi:hypothetical protein